MAFLVDEFAPASDFERLLEWVRLGASHVRNNDAFVEEHRQRLRARGETKVRLSEFNQWHPSPVFTEKEKTGLRLSQAISLHEPPEKWSNILREAHDHFSTHQIVRLMLAIVSVNDRIDYHAKAYDYVLVIEDDPWDEELLLRQMRKAQMTESVLFAQNGWQALELIEDSKRWEWRFSAIFLDLQLPDMKGLALMKRIREIPGMKRIPVIATTSSDNSRERLECEKLEIAGYLEKPITPHSFAKAIEAIR